MLLPSTLFRLGAVAIAVGAALLGAVAMPAAQDSREVRVEASQAKLINLPAAATTVFVADPAIADVQTPTPTQIIVYGKTPGRTSVMALGDGRRLVANLSVTVDYPISDIMHVVRSELPDADIRLLSTPRGIVATGSVPNPAASQLIASVVGRYLNTDDQFIDNMRVETAVQVALTIRIAEVSREAIQELGVNWGAVFDDGSIAIGLATGRPPIDKAGDFIRNRLGLSSLGFGARGDNFNANVVLDALARNGMATILAEPTLTALSGQPARFLSGGEFPIPVARDTASGQSAITVEFKKFGIALDFTPTVLSPERISLRVRPEVSELSEANSVEIDGLKIPGLAVRTAETTIELGSGQTFAIAGLFQDSTVSNVDSLPGLGDIPVLGALFRSDKFRRKETELVILVTPYLARPVSDRTALTTPVDRILPANDLGRVLTGNQTISTPAEGPPPATPPGDLSGYGEAGFIVE